MTGSATAAADDWATNRADGWVRASAGLEGQLAPVGELLFARAGLAPGERVLDVGCGTGPTTLQAAAAVGPTGAVTGLDVAAAMLDAARRRPVAAGSAAIDWVVGDAQTWPGAGADYDVVLSRFGAMFFGDPQAAFANLRERVAPGGRLHLAVWARRDRSPLFELPLSVALAACARWGLAPEVPPADAGAFSLGDESAVRSLLGAAGWRDITFETATLALPVAGGAAPAEAALNSMEFGPTRRVTAELDDDRRQQVVAAIADAYEDHVDGGGRVVLDATPAIIGARRPAGD